MIFFATPARRGRGERAPRCAALRPLTSTALCIGLALMLAAPLMATAQATPPGACKSIHYAVERQRLDDLLRAEGAPSGERSFLLVGADRRLREIRPAELNPAGRACGVEAVRAMVFGCVNATLPDLLRALPEPERPFAETLWGRTGLSNRAGAFVAMFHACRGTAAESFKITP